MEIWPEEPADWPWWAWSLKAFFSKYSRMSRASDRVIIAEVNYFPMFFYYKECCGAKKAVMAITEFHFPIIINAEQKDKHRKSFLKVLNQHKILRARTILI